MDVDRLLRLNARPMLQLADFVLSDPSAAEDAVERAFVAAWRQRKGLKDEAAFRPWLRRIVLRECLRWRRHPLFRVLAMTDRVVVQRRRPPNQMRQPRSSVSRRRFGR